MESLSEPFCNFTVEIRIKTERLNCMNNKKKWLGIFAVVFLVVVLIVTWDIMRQTSRPGAQKQLPTRMMR